MGIDSTTNNPYKDNDALDALRYSVYHPIYYGGSDNEYEAIKVIEAYGWGREFCLGNVLKYISRAGRKDPAKAKEDLEKARWYLDRAIEEIGRHERS